MHAQEMNEYTGKTECHQLCFDSSGLDMTHKNDLPKLVEMRIEHDIKGSELICAFANKYAIEGKISLWQGNKIKVTSNMDKALKLYLVTFAS